MKMPEKRDLLARHSRNGNGKASGRQSLRFAMARTFAADIMAVRLQKQ